MKHKSFINQLSHAKGSRTRSVEAILDMFRTLFEQLQDGIYKDETIIEAMRSKKSLSKLADEQPEFDEPVRRQHSKAVERAKVVQEIIDNRSKCSFCKARYAPAARGKDHIIPKEKGGMGTLDNLDFLHPFCNQLKQSNTKRNAARTS